MKYFLSIICFVLLTVFSTGFSQNSCASGGLVFIENIQLQEAFVDALGDVDAYTCDGLSSLKTLAIARKGITSLDGIQHATNLTTLIAPNNAITDISPITQLRSLEVLNVSNNELSVLPDLSQNTSLININLAGNTINNINPLVNISTLTTLNLTGNPIPFENLRLLSQLPNLNSLSIPEFGLTDLRQVFALFFDYQSVVSLDISGNDISDLSLLPNFASLKFLTATDNGIRDISALAQMTTLSRINLSNNYIADLTPLSNLSNLSFLILNSNHVKSLEAIYALENLVQLQLRDNFLDSLHEFRSSSNFGGLPRSFIRVDFNCLTQYDMSALSDLVDSDDVRVVTGRQKRLTGNRADAQCTDDPFDGPSIFSIGLDN